MEIDLTQFKINRFKIEVVPLPGGYVQVRPVMYVPAVGDTIGGRHGQEIDLCWNESIKAAQWEAMGPKAKAEFAVKMALKLLDHELREQLCVDGERPLYPHPGTPPPAYEQYRPTRKEFRPAWTWDRLSSEIPFDFKPRSGVFFFLDEAHSMPDYASLERRWAARGWMKPRGMGKPPAKAAEPSVQAKPPRARYMKPRGGFPGQDLVRPKGRDHSHSRGVR